MGSAGDGPGPGSIRAASDWWFWAVLALLVLYVGLCTGQRETRALSDDWEHHRAILALSKDPWKPGNPTYATDEPSIRYSPYSLALAGLVRTGLVDAYGALGLAAVGNTILLGLAIRSFLGSQGCRGLEATTLVVMVCLYGTSPDYANSYALADLPVHQVNPSAFSFPLALFMWSWFRRLADTGPSPVVLAAIIVMGALAMLSHPMTGAAAGIGLGAIALVAPPSRRIALMIGLVVVGVGMLALCAAWPWYDFVAALRGGDHDKGYWYNGAILRMMLVLWSAPAIVLALCAWPLRDRELVRLGFLGAAIFYGFALSSMATRSPTTARFPMVGIFYLHVLVAAYLDDSGVFRPSSWRARLRDLFACDYGRAARPILDVIALLVLAYCSLPQAWQIVREPALARAYIAPYLRFEDKQNYLKQRFDRLLAGVGDRDVVLSDPITSWPVPSSRGRIVAAAHLEFFTPDQSQRHKDVATFFGPASDQERRAILGRYRVRWLLLDRDALPSDVYAALLKPSAVAASDRNLTLMDARLWEAVP